MVNRLQSVEAQTHDDVAIAARVRELRRVHGAPTHTGYGEGLGGSRWELWYYSRPESGNYWYVFKRSPEGTWTIHTSEEHERQP